jgi:diguanylate cyclase
LHVVAEGVETADQLAHVRRLGCAFVQGYHFGRPMPPDEIWNSRHEATVRTAS